MEEGVGEGGKRGIGGSGKGEGGRSWGRKDGGKGAVDVGIKNSWKYEESPKSSISKV